MIFGALQKSKIPKLEGIYFTLHLISLSFSFLLCYAGAVIYCASSYHKESEYNIYVLRLRMSFLLFDDKKDCYWYSSSFNIRI